MSEASRLGQNDHVSSGKTSVERGRFAPSPTGPLHLGNLRTAIASERSARLCGGEFIIRMEDLDQANSKRIHGDVQLADLAAVGVSSDEEVVWQSDRFDLYREILTRLNRMGSTYECFCSRKDIAGAVAAPHGPMIAYPGTCRDLSESQRIERRRDRKPAIRLRTDSVVGSTYDGAQDVVLWRNDGSPAYNLAVVVDDELQGVTQVVRGEDLQFITPSQNYLQSLLSFRIPNYVHVPLLVGPDGQRLAKRHGAVTLADAQALGFSAFDVREALVNSLRVGSHGWDSSSNLGQWLKSLLSEPDTSD